VKISDESGMKRVVLQLETLPAPAMEKICSTLEDYFQGGLHELQQNATTAHPLLQDGMRSVAWFRVRHVVRKRLDEYLGRLKDALEFVKTERGLVLTGERKVTYYFFVVPSFVVLPQYLLNPSSSLLEQASQLVARGNSRQGNKVS
jgi:hypothetical protein